MHPKGGIGVHFNKIADSRILVENRGDVNGFKDNVTAFFSVLYRGHKRTLFLFHRLPHCSIKRVIH